MSQNEHLWHFLFYLYVGEHAKYAVSKYKSKYVSALSNIYCFGPVITLLACVLKVHLEVQLVCIIILDWLRTITFSE